MRNCDNTDALMYIDELLIINENEHNLLVERKKDLKDLQQQYITDILHVLNILQNNLNIQELSQDEIDLIASYLQDERQNLHDKLDKII